MSEALEIADASIDRLDENGDPNPDGELEIALYTAEGLCVALINVKHDGTAAVVAGPPFNPGKVSVTLNPGEVSAP